MHVPVLAIFHNTNYYVLLTQVFETWHMKMESGDRLQQMRIQIMASALEITLMVLS